MALKCSSTEIMKDGTEKKLGPNWRQTEFLWKPKAEHYDGLVVLTLPIGKVSSVVVYNAADGKKIKTLLYRPHRPSKPELPVGDAWAHYDTTGAEYQKAYPKGVIVKVTYKGAGKKIRQFKLTCPKNRSDGRPA